MGFVFLKEILVVVLLEMVEYFLELFFLDFLCGFGILFLEVSLKVLNIVFGLLKNNFFFMNWCDFDKLIW